LIAGQALAAAALLAMAADLALVEAYRQIAHLEPSRKLTVPVLKVVDQQIFLILSQDPLLKFSQGMRHHQHHHMATNLMAATA